MKKLITTLFVLAAISTAAIAETKLFSVSFIVPLDNITEKTVSTNSISGSGTTTNTVPYNNTSIGFSISGVNMFNKIIGIYTDLDFGFAQSFKRDDNVASRSDHLGPNGTQFSMNLFLGPAFRVFENKSFFITASPAIHMYLNSDKARYTTKTGVMLGLAADVSFTYFLTKTIGLTAGFDFGFDFIGLGDYRNVTDSYPALIGTTTYTRSYTNFNFTPKLGLSFRFQ